MNEKSKRFAVAFVAVFALLGAKATDQFVNTPCDIATLEVTGDPVYFNGNSPETPYTLSADTDLSAKQLSISSGSSAFDFSNGNHTLQLKTFFVCNGGTATPYVGFKGGVWDLGNRSDFRFANGNATHVKGRQMVLDSVAVTNVNYFWGMPGENCSIVMTNGASLTANSPKLFMPGEVGTTFRTNCTFRICDGSCFAAVGAGSYVVFDNSGSSDALTGNRLIIEDAGTLFVGSRAYSAFTIGGTTSGNSAVIRNGAEADWYDLVVGGAANAKYNSLRITDPGTTVVGGGALSIGTRTGSDHNRVEILNGADLKTQNYNACKCGAGGSFNELVISNSTVSRTYYIGCGTKAGASNNTVRIEGNVPITMQNAGHILFGQGQHNDFIFKNTTQGKKVSTRIYFSNVSKDGASTNNTLRVENSTMNIYDLQLDSCDQSNTIFLVDSVWNEGHDFYIRGSGNRLIVSNSVMYLTQSGENLRIGNEGDNDPVHPEGGNEIVFAGANTKVRKGGVESSGAKFHDGTVITFDVPSTGFAEPVFSADGGIFCSLYDTSRIRFANVDRLQAEIARSTDFVIAENVTAMPPTTQADLIAQTNLEDMPKDCYAYFEGSTLKLHVKTHHGFVISVE